MDGPQLLSAYAGHWTGAGTGVTVILPPPGTVASGEVRGGAPATREFPLLDPTRLVDRVDAVVLSGGSAYGLAAADGVMSVLRERGTGFPTPAGPVPIVIAMSIFDASVSTVPPDATAGREAALAALSGTPFTAGGRNPADGVGLARGRGVAGGRELAGGAGRVGAGAGASSGKWRGRLDPGGLGVAERAAGPARVAAVAVVNAWGDVLAADGRPMFAAPAGQGDASEPAGRGGAAGPVEAMFGRGNTTLAVVITDARLSKTDCFLLAQSGHTGFARAIHPAHSRYDGDAVVTLATGEVTDAVDVDLLRAIAAETVAAAIRAAVADPR